MFLYFLLYYLFIDQTFPVLRHFKMSERPNRNPAPTGQPAKIVLTPELDEMLRRIQDTKNVAGIMLINKEGLAVKSSLDSSVTAQYSGLISYFAERAKATVQSMDPTNELLYLRVTSRRHEILVAPDDDFVLIVMQNPSPDH